VRSPTRRTPQGAQAFRWGPLHGLPIAYKDLCDIAGRIGTGGSKMLAKRVATETSGNMQGCIVAAALEQC
jgi:Asp-tRNA(Asn)/Glu-tRNA(Gln) amidotransferase A subunit family amidase